jgi:hypothetical protein
VKIAILQIFFALKLQQNYYNYIAMMEIEIAPAADDAVAPIEDVNVIQPRPNLPVGFHHIDEKPKIIFVQDASFKKCQNTNNFGQPLLISQPISLFVSNKFNYHRHFAIYNINVSTAPKYRKASCMLCNQVLAAENLQTLRLHISNKHQHLRVLQDFTESEKNSIIAKWSEIADSDCQAPAVIAIPTPANKRKSEPDQSGYNLKPFSGDQIFKSFKI